MSEVRYFEFQISFLFFDLSLSGSSFINTKYAQAWTWARKQVPEARIPVSGAGWTIILCKLNSDFLFKSLPLYGSFGLCWLNFEIT